MYIVCDWATWKIKAKVVQEQPGKPGEEFPFPTPSIFYSLYWDIHVFYIISVEYFYFVNFTDLGLCHKIQKSLKAFQISRIITSYTLVWDDDLHRVLSVHFLIWYIYAEIPYIQENFGKSALVWVSVMSPWSEFKRLGGHLQLWIFQ